MSPAIDTQLATHAAGHAVMAHVVGRPFHRIVVGPGTIGCTSAWAPRSDPRHYSADLMVLAAGAVAEVRHHRGEASVQAELDEGFLTRLTDRYGGMSTQWTASLYRGVHTVLGRRPWVATVELVADQLVRRGSVRHSDIVAIVRSCTADCFGS